jgi:hypothetical protein
VRVYAEAKTQQQADALADEVSKLLVWALKAAGGPQQRRKPIKKK